MKKFLTVFVLTLCLPLMAFADIRIEEPHAFATSRVQKNGAVFMTITNTSDVGDRVIGASTEVAERAELHTHIMDGDMMMMREVDGYDLPSHATTALEPMGHHIMLMGLHERLAPGDHFSLILSFEKNDPIILDVPVKTYGEE